MATSSLHTLYTTNYGWYPPLCAEHGSALIYGPAGSGKSTLLRSLWYHSRELAPLLGSSYRRWFSNFHASKYRQNVPYSAELLGKVALQQLVIADNPSELAEQLCLLLVAKQVGLCDPRFSTLLSGHAPWMTPGARVAASELKQLSKPNAHLQLVLALDNVCHQLVEEGQQIWLAFDGWDDCVTELGEERDLAVQQLLGRGLLRILSDFWRRWGMQIHLVVALRSAVVQKAGPGAGSDFSKVLMDAKEISWSANHLWSLLSRYVLNHYSVHPKKVTRMDISHDLTWGWSCTKQPTLEQVLGMIKRSGRELKPRAGQTLHRIDAGKVTGMPALVLDLALGTHEVTELPQPPLHGLWKIREEDVVED